MWNGGPEKYAREEHKRDQSPQDDELQRRQQRIHETQVRRKVISWDLNLSFTETYEKTLFLVLYN